jgi:hypothetical protein
MRAGLKARLSRIEARRIKRAGPSVAEILEGYRTGRLKPPPAPTRAEVEAELNEPGWRGRLARARLRAGLYREAKEARKAREGTAP